MRVPRPARRLALTGVLVAAVVLGVVDAHAKDFGPGDLRVCGAKRCVSITNRRAVAELGPFYYSGPARASMRAPRLGAPAYELRFTNGYATGIVASPKLDRFLSYGVHLARFARGTWYRVPPALSLELRALTVRLAPLRVTRAAIARSRSGAAQTGCPQHALRWSPCTASKEQAARGVSVARERSSTAS